MGDFGAKVALAGADVITAPDYNLLFSSSWPNIKVIDSIITDAVDDSLIVYKHNLGFVPAFIPYGGLGKSPQTAQMSRQNITVDKTNFYYIPGGPFAPGPLHIGLTYYDIDIETAFIAPEVATGSSVLAHPDPDFGIKLAKDGKDISSNDLRDYIFHSSARSPMLHAVVTGRLPAATLPAVTTFSYTYDLSYTPIFMSFLETSTLGRYQAVNGYAGTATQGNTISISGSLTVTNPQPRVSIVILKDPFSIEDNIITVTL